MSKSPNASIEWTKDDPETDEYPTLYDVTQRISNEVKGSKLVVERVEITCLASGEATYRMWAPRADEATGGYLPPG